MSRRRAAIALSRSFALLASLRFNSGLCLTMRTWSLPRYRPVFLLNSSRSSSSSSSSRPSLDNELNGFVDPDFVFASDNGHRRRETKQEGSVSAKDFAFLQDAVAGGEAISVQKNHSSGIFSEEAALISDGIKTNGSDFGEQTQIFLRQFRRKLSEGLVIEVLRLLKDPALGVSFFVWAGRQIGYRHSGPTYDCLLEVLGFDKKNRIPEHLLREIGEDDREVLGKLLNLLIHKCCWNGYWNEALEEMGRLKDFGYRPSRTTYNALMQVLLDAERMDSAFLLQREMADSGHTMYTSTMGCFVYALCKVGRWEEALSTMEREDFTPVTVVYNKMIGGLLEASLYEEAMSFLHRMRSNSCLPNVVTYRTLLSGFLRKKQHGWCKRIVNMMITEGCNPSPSLFNSLVHAYCSSGDYGYAYKLLKKMTDCGCRPGYVTYNILIGGICGNEDLPSSVALQQAEKAYEEMLEAGFVLNKVNVGNFTRCLCGSGKFDKAFVVIKELMRKGFIPDTNTYANVIEFLCQANKVEKAFLLFQEMKRNGVSPDVYTYTILIDSFAKAGLLQQARNWFDEMIRDGCAPNVVTYTALIHAHLKARKVTEANELFERMFSAGCQPNVVTYSALIDGLCKAGKVEKACQIYFRMKGSTGNSDANIYFRDSSEDGTNPNVFTYGALVDGLCKIHKVVEARDLLEIMSNSGCEPNHVVYDALIDGFCKSGKLDEAQELFLRMSERGYTPNVYTYSSFIDRLFKDKRLDLSLKVLSRMLENNCAPNVITYTVMIDGLCKVDKTDEAYKLLLMMEEKGCKPNVVTYTAMIDGFGKVGKIQKCLELFKQMISKDCAPNFITYRVLINHCCVAGLLDEAHDLLEEMKQTYWPSDVACYHDVIHGFSREFLISHGLLEEIAKDGLDLVAPAYCILVDSLSKAGRLEIALELYREIMGSSSAHITSSAKNTSSTLIESLCLASKVDIAFDLYVEMTTRGDIPEFVIIFHLIKGLIKIGKWDDALLFSYSICHMDISWHPKTEAYYEK